MLPCTQCAVFGCTSVYGTTIQQNRIVTPPLCLAVRYTAHTAHTPYSRTAHTPYITIQHPSGSISRRGRVCGCWARLAWDMAIDGHPGSSVSRRDRLPRLPPSARAPPLGPGRPCEQRQQQRRRARWCSCSAGARAARSCAGTWQHRDVDADRRAPSQRCLASRGGARAPLAARRSLGRRRGGRGGQRSRGHRPWEVASTTLMLAHDCTIVVFARQ